MNCPEDLVYTKEHEWARVDRQKKVATIGITEYAQEKLGDVVYVELPSEGKVIKKENPFGSVESVKAVSDLFAPLDGMVLKINDALADAPETVNEDPYGKAWMIEVQVTDMKQVDQLMSADDYKKHIAALEE